MRYVSLGAMEDKKGMQYESHVNDRSSEKSGIRSRAAKTDCLFSMKKFYFSF